MKKLRNGLATIIVGIVMAATAVMSILLNGLIFVIVGDEDKACELIVDVKDSVERWIFSHVF